MLVPEDTNQNMSELIHDQVIGLLGDFQSLLHNYKD